MEGTVWGAALALAYLGTFQGVGLCLSRAALPGESPGMRLLLGSVWGSVALQWFPVLLAFFLGFTPAAHLGALMLALLVGGAALWLGRSTPFGFRKACAALGRRWFLWVVLGVWLFFCFLVWHSFRWQDGAVYSSQATYGDMSMHLSFITSLANQGDFPPDYSLLPGTQLSYPFLSDSISASLYLLGAPLWFAYELPMWVAGAQVLFGLYAFFSVLTDSRGQAALSWVFFAFTGGLGFLYFVGGGAENFTRIFTAFYETPTNLIGENIRWVNVLVDMMLPQRATLFGWAVLFPALYLLYRGVYGGQGRCFLWVGGMAGALPMIHTHSFLALGVLCGGWLGASLLARLSWERRAAQVGKGLLLGTVAALALGKELARGREDSPLFLYLALGVLALFVGLVALLAGTLLRRGEGRVLLPWGVLLGVTLVLALPQLFVWTFQQAAAGSFVRGHLGWVLGDDSYLGFYLKNLGLVGLLALGGLLLSKGGAFLRLAPGLLLWLLAELVLFQPNEYDNNKLLYPAFAFLCCGAARCAAEILGALRSRKARAGAAAGLVALSTCSAVLTMGREAVARYELFGIGAVELAQWVEESTDPQAVILTDTRHNNEIASLAGRNLVCGSPSYLYYHGLDYAWQQEAAYALYTYPRRSRELIGTLDVSYILVSDFERSAYSVDQEALDDLYPRVYDDGNRVLYQVVEDAPYSAVGEIPWNNPWEAYRGR